MSSREIVFEVEELSDGGYVARAVGESIFVEDDGLESLRANVLDAINCHFEPDKKPEFLQLQWADAGLTAEQMAELDRRIEIAGIIRMPRFRGKRCAKNSFILQVKKIELPSN